VAGLFLALFFLPIAIIQSGEKLYTFHITGLHTTSVDKDLVYPAWALFAIAAIIVLLSFVVIFLYRWRILQIRISIYNTLLMIGFCALTGYFLWIMEQLPDLAEVKINFRFWASFPIIAIIINYLAIRNIGVDEAMVRSLERLR
jgi:ABC-type multidrug transport system fused ATPase/permease subunit